MKKKTHEYRIFYLTCLLAIAYGVRTTVDAGCAERRSMHSSLGLDRYP